MTKEFYLITLKLQKPLHCKILKEEIRPRGMNNYLLELENPLPRSVYLSLRRDESDTRFGFYPTGTMDAQGVLRQSYGENGPFRGTIYSVQDVTNIDLDSPIGGLERVMLCVSEEQAQEYMQFLEEAKQGPYILDICGMKLPPRDCRIIKDVVFEGGEKGYWLAEVNPPFPAQAFGMEKDFSRVLLALGDLPVLGQPITCALCFVDQDIAIRESVTPQEIGLKEVGEGALWRPQDHESFYRCLKMET